jgi:hypothetical protein
MLTRDDDDKERIVGILLLYCTQFYLVGCSGVAAKVGLTNLSGSETVVMDVKWMLALTCRCDIFLRSCPVIPSHGLGLPDIVGLDLDLPPPAVRVPSEVLPTFSLLPAHCMMVSYGHCRHN